MKRTHGLLGGIPGTTVQGTQPGAALPGPSGQPTAATISDASSFSVSGAGETSGNVSEPLSSGAADMLLQDVGQAVVRDVSQSLRVRGVRGESLTATDDPAATATPQQPTPSTSRAGPTTARRRVLPAPRKDLSAGRRLRQVVGGWPTNQARVAYSELADALTLFPEHDSTEIAGVIASHLGLSSRQRVVIRRRAAAMARMERQVAMEVGTRMPQDWTPAAMRSALMSISEYVNTITRRPLAPFQ